MPSDPSSDPTAAPRQSGMAAPPSQTERIQAWMSANTLPVEILLTALSIAVWVIALPVVIFGSFTALGGDTSILSAGMMIVAAGSLGVIVLAAWVLIRTVIDIRNHGPPLRGADSTRAIAYDGIQSLKAATAGVFATSLLAYGVLSLTVQSGPTLVLQLIGVCGILLPVLVLIHGLGAFIGYLFYLK
ncbi:hypothetical protein BDK61_4748 [Haloarcula quadrata]|uniref:Uncharacterized protein n=1 Tax=Haloarcula quadrata TaxID=182779 RepID=A0A495QQG6_9EURY|nr:hypothetical protein [Haloarcula quadrata]RKS75201.1 hypothetical protein BDK61_4748 [Haloarcula quadrata]